MRPYSYLAVGLLSVFALSFSAQATTVLRLERPETTALFECGVPGALCGLLVRPLDPLGQVPGNLPIVFEFYRHQAKGPARGTLVATEGGPGFSARESRRDYLHLFKPLMKTHDVLIMDNRGTGGSGALNCPSLQASDAELTLTAIAQCGADLGPAAWLYSTSYAADDLAAVLDALSISTIDLYGDSYGTFTAQTFALRHPERLRTLTLDGAYPLVGREAGWYTSYAPAMRDKFNLACTRSPTCAMLSGTSMDRLQSVLRRLRKNAQSIQAVDFNGKKVAFKADGAALATMLFGAAPALATVREADAAARAYLADDPAPLHRLLAEAHVSVDSRDESSDPRIFSSGLAAAIMCGDAPQIFTMTRSPVERIAERDQALRDRQQRVPDAYAPFSYDEYRSLPLDYAFIDQCVLWPTVELARYTSLHEQEQRPYPSIPVLVLSGELDNMTTVSDGREVAEQFPHGHQVILKNSFHVNALARARSPCGAQITRAFIKRAAIGDTACRESIPAVPLVQEFHQHARQVPPVRLVHPSPITVADRQAIAIALESIEDVLIRQANNSSGTGVGLRGGTFYIASQHPQTVLTLQAVAWTDDAKLTGTVTIASKTRQLHAKVQVEGPEHSRLLDLRWKPLNPAVPVTVRGQFAGRTRVMQVWLP